MDNDNLALWMADEAVKKEEPLDSIEYVDQSMDLARSLAVGMYGSVEEQPSSSSSLPRMRRTRAKATKNRSPFLRYFIATTDPAKLRCGLCPVPVEVRYMYGSKKVTSSLRDHLQACHPSEMAEVAEGDGRHEEASRHLLRAVATGVLPLAATESDEIRRFVRCLDSSFVVPDTQGLCGGVLETEFDSVYESVMQIVVNEDVAVTVDEWEGRIGVTSSTIDDQWKRHTVVVAIEDEPEPHMLRNLKNEFRFDSITALISDDETVNNGDVIKLGCVLRAVDSLVRESLSEYVRARDLIAVLRNVATTLKQPTSWKRLRDKLAAGRCEERRRLPLHEELRLQTCLRMMRIADAQIEYLNDVFVEAGEHPLSEVGRLFLRRLVEFLGEVDDFAAKMATQQATLSSLIPYLKGLENTIEELKDGPLHEFYPVILRNFTKRLASYRNYSIVQRSYLLDPRFLHMENMLETTVRAVALEELFKAADEDCSSTVSDDPPQKRPRSNLLAKAAPLASMKAPSHAKREYQQLLDLAMSHNLLENEDIYAFWKANEAKFPRLAPIARKLLAIPPSSINSERFRAMMGRVPEEVTKSNVSPDSAKKLLFVGAYCKKDRIRFQCEEEYDTFYDNTR